MHDAIRLQRTLTVLFLFYLSTAFLSAQVHIHEKVTLTPILPTQSLGGDGTTSLSVVFSVNKPIALRLFVNRECGGPANDGLPFEGTGHITYETSQADIGAYEFNAQTRVAEIPLGDSVTAVFELYAAGVLAYRSEMTYVGGGYDVYAVWFPKTQFLPYASGFWFYPSNGCVRSGDNTSMTVPVTTYCWEDIVWSPERDPITFSISQGQALGQLQDRMGHVLGRSATLKWDDAQGLTFAAFPGLPQGGTVQIDALVGEIQRTAYLNVYAANEYSLALSAYDSEVQHGQQVQLLGRAVACEGAGIRPPEGTTYSFRIAQGEEYGRLYDEETEAAGDNLPGIPPYNGAANIWFQAWEAAPTEPQTVTVEMSSEGKAPVTTSFQVTPGGLAITALPATLNYGERSTISVRKILTDGTTEALGPEATVTYRIVGGNQAGTLQDHDSTERADELIFPSDTVVQFSALEESPQPDTLEVLIQVEVNEGIIIIGRVSDSNPATPNGGHADLSQSPAPSLSNASSSGFFFGLSGIARVQVIKGEHEIMLGETKFFQAKFDPSDDSKLIIEELAGPTLNGGIASDVWGGNPLTILAGAKLGTYWEKKFPLWQENVYSGMVNLPPGLLRLVGRYWDKDSTYRVRLSACYGTRSAELDIVVVSPSKLGSSQYALNRRYSRDVFDTRIDIDSICISYGGSFGVPPQLIKGQICKEARYVTDFGLSPSYRYEPYTAQFWKAVRNRTHNPFYITSSIRTPEPPHHRNVRDIDYFSSVQTVWDVIREHSQLIDDIPDDPHRLYGIRRYDGKMNFQPYSRIQRMYDGFLTGYLTDFELPLPEATDSARARMIVYLRDEWSEHVPRNCRGLASVTAQTRIASSYGLLQPMYTTALSFGYQEDGYRMPELLNLTDTSMTVAMQFQKRMLKAYLGEATESQNCSWPNGYEESFFRGVYPKWNSISTYANLVFEFSSDFPPQKTE